MASKRRSSAIEYDPIRTARLALLQYKDGEKAYIIAPAGLQVGAKLMSGPTAPPEVGNCLPLKSDSGRRADSQYRNDSRPRRPDGPHAPAARRR